MKLATVLDLGAATPLWAAFCESRGQPMSIDASGVERVGGQCLQVLLAARAQWAADGVPFAFAETSPAFMDALTLTGTEDMASAEMAR